MLKTIIVDDEILVLNLLKNKLKNHEDIKIIGEYTNPRLALEMITDLKPDLLFLDIDMPGLNGIELAIEILDRLEHINIIFVTAYDQYAVEAFKLNAIHYILKPPAKGEIEQAIERVIRQGKRTIKT